MKCNSTIEYVRIGCGVDERRRGTVRTAHHDDRVQTALFAEITCREHRQLSTKHVGVATRDAGESDHRSAAFLGTRHGFGQLVRRGWRGVWYPHAGRPLQHHAGVAPIKSRLSGLRIDHLEQMAV